MAAHHQQPWNLWLLPEMPIANLNQWCVDTDVASCTPNFKRVLSNAEYSYQLDILLTRAHYIVLEYVYN